MPSNTYSFKYLDYRCYNSDKMMSIRFTRIYLMSWEDQAGAKNHKEPGQATHKELITIQRRPTHAV